MNVLGATRSRVLGISIEQTRVARRGFRVGQPSMKERLEEIGRAFLTGYHAALREGDPTTVGSVLRASTSPELQGFAFEGAGMGLALRERLTPWKSGLLTSFLEGAGARHIYMVHVGAGWALARVRLRPERLLGELDPLLRWLAWDGYGFHQGYFRWRRFVDAAATPDVPDGYARRAFDQGLGRSLWFVEGADAGQIASRIGTFDSDRHADLWSGVGLAATYAGGVDRVTLETLGQAAGSFRPHLAQGAAFAARARELAGNNTTHTELAAGIFCGSSASEAARWVEVALAEVMTSSPARASERRSPASDRTSRTSDGRSPVSVQTTDDLPVYEHWRVACRRRFCLVAVP